MEAVAGGGGGGGAVGAGIANVSLTCEALLLDATPAIGSAPLPWLLLAERLPFALAATLDDSAALEALEVADAAATDFEAAWPPAAAAICRANSRSSRSSSRFLRLDAALESAPPCRRCI